MNKKRLLKLADFLDTVPNSRFNLGIIAEENENGHRPSLEKVGCGTAACAVGWTPHVFPKSCRYASEYGTIEVEGKDSYEGFENLEFALHFFELEDDDVEYLFISDSYPNGDKTSPKTVAKRIREFVKNGGVPENYLTSKLDEWGY